MALGNFLNNLKEGATAAAQQIQGAINGATTTEAPHDENAAEVTFAASNGITSNATQVLSVNGAAPAYFRHGSAMGVYLNPGDSVLAVRYSFQRPGLMYKNVTSTLDGSVTVTAEANKRYVIGYDSKAEQFTFTEQ